MGLAPRRAWESTGSVVALASAERRRPEGVRQIEALARSLAPLGPPVVVFNASHSGSRLLAQMLRRLGVFIGSDLNESEDSLPIFDLVQYLIESHAPDFSSLFAAGDPELEARVTASFTAHLADRPVGQAWGWKLPETSHVLPLISRLFPQARCIHLVRDGRDVAFSPFVAPKARFWRKVYFNDEQIRSWRGHGMTQRAYRAHGHQFNAARWVNSVTLGRAHGAMLGERYFEMRYEAIVSEPAREFARLAAFLGIDPPWPAFGDNDVSQASVGKWRRQPGRQVAEARAVLEPTLASFGYRWEEPSFGRALGEALAELSARFAARSGVSAGPNAEPGGLGGLFRIQDRR